MANTYPNKRSLADKYLTARHADITIATASAYAVVAGQGDLVGARSVTEGAITSADETLNIYKNGVDTGYDIVVAVSGAAAGNVDSVDIPPGAVSLKDGDYLTIVSANASGGTIAAAITYVIREA